MRQRLLNETEEDRHERKIAKLEWRRKDHSLIHVDDYSASFKDERFANLSDAERKKRFKSEMSYFQRWLMRARAAES